MAISANAVFEVRTTGADTNGGGFVTGASGTDYSQQDSAQYALTNGQTQGTTVILLAAAASDMVGNIAYISGGTGAVVATRRQITAVNVGVSITVDSSTGLTSGTGVTVNIGGALQTIAAGIAFMVAGNICWVKSGTYNITSSITFNPGNALPNGVPTYLLGYNSSRGDNPTGNNRPLINSSSAIASLVNVSKGPRVFAHFRLNGNDSVTDGLTMGDTFDMRGAQITNVKVEQTTRYGIVGQASNQHGGITGCEVTDLKTGATAGIYGGVCVACYVHDSPGVGFRLVQSAVSCVADTMTGDGFQLGDLGYAVFVNHCVAYACGGDGFEFAETYSSIGAFLNSISYGNTGFGLKIDKTERIARPNLIDYNAVGSNTAGARSNFQAGPHDVTLTADPFTDAANGDFSLNSTAGGGAALKALGFPPTLPV